MEKRINLTVDGKTELPTVKISLAITDGTVTVYAEMSNRVNAILRIFADGTMIRTGAISNYFGFQLDGRGRIVDVSPVSDEERRP